MSCLNRLFVAAALVGMMVLASVGAQPADPAPEEAEWTLSEPRVIEAPPITLLHTTFETTFEQMKELHHVVDGLIRAAGDNHIDAEGYLMMIYKGVQRDRSKPFQLTVGLVVPADTKPVGTYEVEALPAFKCAAALYNGWLPTIGQAYEQHYGALIAAGHEPIEESRELYLYWEGENSTNNVVWIQAGIR